MTKKLLLKLFFFNALCAQSIGANPFFSNTPLDGLKNSVSDYNSEKFRDVLKNSYQFHFVNNAMSFDVDTALLKKCEHKTIDTSRLYEIIHDFQALKNAIKETKEKTRMEYALKGGASAAIGMTLAAVSLFFAQHTYRMWERVQFKNEQEVAAAVIALPATACVPALYYAYTTGQLGKAWNYEENRTKLAAIEQDIQKIAKIIHDRTQSFADDDTKKVLKSFVEEMSSK
ncbi:hypothetical protein HYX58_04760 [Candidatus Dependentiae bacterium]|nr:hypothetical protein [Candidatus Dependentiae bacterium]